MCLRNRKKYQLLMFSCGANETMALLFQDWVEITVLCQGLLYPVQISGAKAAFAFKNMESKTFRCENF